MTTMVVISDTSSEKKEEVVYSYSFSWIIDCRFKTKTKKKSNF